MGLKDRNYSYSKLTFYNDKLVLLVALNKCSAVQQHQLNDVSIRCEHKQKAKSNESEWSFKWLVDVA